MDWSDHRFLGRSPTRPASLSGVTPPMAQLVVPAALSTAELYQLFSISVLWQLLLQLHTI